MAYAGDDVKPQCKLLNFLDKLTTVMKRPVDRPTAPPPATPKF